MKKNTRIPVNDKLSAEVLYESRHTCCICRTERKHVQIHHIDGNPSNNDIKNLCVLCTDCHSRVTGNEGFGKRYSEKEVTLYRNDWVTICKKKDMQLNKSINEVELKTKPPVSRFDFLVHLNTKIYEIHVTCMYYIEIIPYCSDRTEIGKYMDNVHKVIGKLHDYYYKYSFLGSAKLDEKLTNYSTAFIKALRSAIKVQRLIQHNTNSASSISMDKENRELTDLGNIMSETLPNIKDEIISEMRRIMSYI